MRRELLLLAASLVVGCPKKAPHVDRARDGVFESNGHDAISREFAQGEQKLQPGMADVHPLQYAIDPRGIDSDGVVSLQHAGIRPNVLFLPRTEYPETATFYAYPVVVDVSLLVDETGRVVETKIVTPPNAEFDDAAVADVAKWRFQPMTSTDGAGFRWRHRARLTFRPPPPAQGSNAVSRYGVPASAVGADGVTDLVLAHIHPTAVYQPRMSSKTGGVGQSYVLIEFAVDGNGVVSDARVLTGSGFPALDQAAVDVVKEWRYARIETLDGTPIRWRAKAKLRF